MARPRADRRDLEGRSRSAGASPGAHFCKHAARQLGAARLSAAEGVRVGVRVRVGGRGRGRGRGRSRRRSSPPRVRGRGRVRVG